MSYSNKKAYNFIAQNVRLPSSLPDDFEIGAAQLLDEVYKVLHEYHHFSGLRVEKTNKPGANMQVALRDPEGRGGFSLGFDTWQSHCFVVSRFDENGRTPERVEGIAFDFTKNRWDGLERDYNVAGRPGEPYPRRDPLEILVEALLVKAGLIKSIPPATRS